MEDANSSGDDRGRHSPGEAVASLVIVNYGNHHLARTLLRSLAEHPDHTRIREVVIVDNGYPEQGDSRMLLADDSFPFPLRFVQYHGHSYSGSINLAVQHCTGDVLLLANNDLEWLPGNSIVPAMTYLLENPNVGIAGPQLVFPDGRWQRSAGRFPSVSEALQALCFFGVVANRVASVRHRQRRESPPVQDVEYVDGACMVVSRRCFETLGGWDTSFAFYASDTDFNWRAEQAGWRRVLVRSATVLHVRGASTSEGLRRTYAERLFAAKRDLVERTHGPLSAASYDLLQRAVAIEYALVFRALDLLWPTPASARRAEAAWQRGLAAVGS